MDRLYDIEYHYSSRTDATEREDVRFHRMPSTAIRNYCYDTAEHCLMIQFVSGQAYSYFDVPPDVALGLTGAFSKGRYFQEHIRDRFAYRREQSAA
jgi:hypothetical protein